MSYHQHSGLQCRGCSTLAAVLWRQGGRTNPYVTRVSQPSPRFLLTGWVSERLEPLRWPTLVNTVIESAQFASKEASIPRADVPISKMLHGSGTALHIRFVGIRTAPAQPGYKRGMVGPDAAEPRRGVAA